MTCPDRRMKMKWSYSNAACCHDYRTPDRSTIISKLSRSRVRLL